MLGKNVIIMIIYLIGLVSLLPAMVWEVKQDGTGDFFSIQEGINAAAEGDTVLVYPGTYYENIDFSGKDIVVSSLQLTTGDESYIYNTFIDGNLSGDAVSIINNETSSAKLNGFTIRNARGRGVLVLQSSPTLSNLVVRNNLGKGVIFSGSNSFLENVTITENHSVNFAGGLSISGNSNLTFSAENKCNIYNNTAGYEADIGIHPYQTVPVHVIVDTFTVLDPDWNYTTQSEYLTLSIDNQWLDQIENDLYVAPDGDDNNSGLSPAEPLRSIQWALTRIKADSLNHRTIHLAPGVYSHASSGQLYPLNMRSYVTLQGAGKDQTFIEEEYAPGYPEIQSIIISAFRVTDIGIRDMTFRNIERPEDFATKPLIRIWKLHYPGEVVGIRQNVDISGIRVENCFMADIYKNAGGDFRITDSEFVNNIGSSVLSILAVYVDPEACGDAYMNNLVVMNNQPYTHWGDAYNAKIGTTSVNNVHLSNSIIANNRIMGDDWGPDVLIALGSLNRLTFTNNIVAFNQTVGVIPCGAMILGGDRTIDITNSIFYGNTDYQFLIIPNDSAPAQVNISYSLIEGGTDPDILAIVIPGYPYYAEFNWGDGIIDSSPQFLGEFDDSYDPGDILYYRPSEFSPCIDAGTPDTTGLNIPPYDLLGNQRIWDGLGDGEAIIDIGSFEYNAPEYTSVDDYLLQLPESLLIMNYPNPFNPETTIAFTLPEPGKIRLSVYNIRGRFVRELLNEFREAGEHRVVWDGRDERGYPVSSGVYFYRLSAGDITEQRKMMLLK